MIDIIIPVLNEEKILREKADYYGRLKEKARIIFVDGGSRDETPKVAKQFGEVLFSSPGRAAQKNRGAAVAQSDKLIFLHVDSFIDTATIGNIEQALSNGVCGGCLTIKIEHPGLIFRIFERIVNLRAKAFGVMDGDLGIFVRKDMFDKIGCFDDVAIMEDILFSKKLRRTGKTITLPDKITVSPRRWQESGFVKTLRHYCLAYMRLWSGTLSLKKVRDEN